MTTDEKLDRIITLLERLLRTPPSKRAPVVADDFLQQITDWLATARPGFHAVADIAHSCGLAGDRLTVREVGRALDILGVHRTKSGSKRGFRISPTLPHSVRP